jgi:hypothetical protein
MEQLIEPTDPILYPDRQSRHRGWRSA